MTLAQMDGVGWTQLDERQDVGLQVYFHLGAYDEALTLALTAEELFYEDTYKIYRDTMTGKGVDAYTTARAALRHPAPGDPAPADIDPRLEAMVAKIFNQCFALGHFKEALGIAVETRRTDMVKATVARAGSEAGALIAYTEQIARSFLQNRSYRNELLRALIDLYAEQANPDFVAMCQCLISLEDPAAVADILVKLAKDKASALPPPCTLPLTLLTVVAEQGPHRLSDRI